MLLWNLNIFLLSGATKTLQIFNSVSLVVIRLEPTTAQTRVHLRTSLSVA